MNDTKNIINFDQHKDKKEIKKMIDHVHLLELRRVIPPKAAVYLINQIMKGKIKNEKNK